MQHNTPTNEMIDKAPTPTAPLYYGWIVTGACFVVISLISSLIASFSLFYVAVLRDFSWTRGQLSIALTLHLLLCGMATPFVGVLIDKFGPRGVMSLGALITASALISLSRAAALWHFYLSFGVF